jgi:fatty-acyl-CoA synthase
MTAWPKQTLATALNEVATAHPELEALVFSDYRYTYHQLKVAVDKSVIGLQQLNIRHGDHIAICMGNSPEWAILFYAAASIGAVTVPVNTRFKSEELLYCLKQADVKLLFIADRFLKIDFIAMLKEICPAINQRLPDPGIPLLENLVVIGNDVPAGALRFNEFNSYSSSKVSGSLHSNDTHPDDVLLMQFTSGTTSFPKGVMLSHDNMLRNAAYISNRFHLGIADRYYSARPFYHVSGSTLSLLASLTSKACLVSAPTFDPEDALNSMCKEQCTHTSGNDTMFLMMMNHPNFDQYSLQLKHGWAAAGPEVSQQVIQKMGIQGLCQAYGLSEASPNVCMSHYQDDIKYRINGWAHTLDDLEVRIVDTDSGLALPAGQSGEIQIRGWSVMKGYYRMPEQTAQAISADGWLRTGDLGVMDTDNRLKFLTRIKDVFRVGGENVAPAEVEEVLLKHPKVKQAQVIGVPDKRLLEVPAAYIILREGESAQTQEIIDWSKQKLANFRVPRYLKIIETFETIGMTGSSKIQKNKLRAQAIIDFNLADQ